MTDIAQRPHRRLSPTPRRESRAAVAPGLGEMGSFLVALVVIAGLAILPLVGWYGGLHPYEVALSVLQILACATGAAWAVHRGLRPCLLVASVFPYCWLAVPSVYQISHGAAAWGDPGVTLDLSGTLRTQGVFVVGQVGLLVGYATQAVRRQRREQLGDVGPAARKPAGLEDVSRGHLLAAAGIFLFVAAALTPLVISSAGGIGALFVSRQEFNQSLAANGGTDNASPLAALFKIFPSALATSSAVLSVWLVRTGPPADPYRQRARMIGLVAFLLLFIVASPFAFSRFLVFASFGPVVLTLFQPRRRLAAIACLVAAVFVFLLAYPAAEIFRRGSDVARSTDPLLASKDFDGFQQGINTMNYVDVHGFGNGIHILSGIFVFVPRAVWPGKATPSAITIAQSRGYNFWNLSMPFPSEIYLDLGWVGVLVVMAGLGIAWGRLDNGWLDRSRIAIVASYLALGQIALWRGPLGSSAPYFGFTVIVLLLVVRWGAGRRPPDPGTTRA